MNGRSWGKLKLEAIFRDHWAGRDVFSISGELGRRSKFGWLDPWLDECGADGKDREGGQTD